MITIEDHKVTYGVSIEPGGTRVMSTCTCGSFSSDPWPVAVESIVDFQAAHLNIPHEQGRAKLRERLERYVVDAESWAAHNACKHDAIAEAAGISVCLDCGMPDPKRTKE